MRGEDRMGLDRHGQFQVRIRNPRPTLHTLTRAVVSTPTRYLWRYRL